MKVEVLSTGSEILRGRNVDTHLGWIARQLERKGLTVRHYQAVDDHLGRLVDALKLAATRADAIVLTGGLGPTEDDFTRAAVEEAFHRPLEFRRELWTAIRERFRKARLRMAAINRRQAFVPRGATVLPNPNGTAPGFLLREGGVLVAALPGPPAEMYPMFLRHVYPKLRGTAAAFGELKVYGIPEATVDEIVLAATGDPNRYGLTVRWGQVSISLRSEGTRAGDTLARWIARLRRALGDNLYDGDLHEHVGRRLIETGTTLALAESCTGGLIAHRLTDVAGISASLLEGVVSYANASKVRRLGVPEALLREHGAVSEPVARAMALGAAREAGADLGLAVTGIAGPSGGSDDKPVGLCYMACGGWVERRVFRGDRGAVKERAAGFALNMLRLRLLRGEGYAGETMGLRERGP
ncbi:MAG TPA: CinA family nicotinamide mononucleotide deamidase-related protein, partial [Planctomycetota bacterium]|nr:CinA family nicotinamide mononucleotide deamidase-related protein [Planctomycetota bacterium]